ncbi:MAG: histidine triad nucleotide-binding protein, partial [Gemmatimonadota bacterium]|nr:histidine triad nucleotide-binding protein [Gemmatimonadota bacterium]
MNDCIFCGIVRGEAPTELIAESDHAVAFNDRSPVMPVHVLVIPRRHIDRLHEATAEDADALVDCLLLANRVADMTGIAGSGYRVATNCGDDAGQVVHHLHFHVIGGAKMNFG